MGSLPNGAKGANGLIAVLLITRSRPGPKLVFHYPPAPQDDPQNSARENGTKSDGNDYDSDCSTDSDSSTRRRQQPQSDSDPSICHETTEELDPLGKVLGHEVGSLERLLSPGRWSEKKKFAICLDGVTFVGLPVFAKEDGTWAARDEGDAAASSQARPAHRTLRQLHKDSSFDTIGHCAPECFWNGLLHDHHAHAIRSLPLFHLPLLIRGTLVRKCRRSFGSYRQVNIHDPENNQQVLLP